MLQTDLNKRLYEAIKSEWLTFQNGDEDFIQSTASACERIVLQEKIEVLDELIKQFRMKRDQIETNAKDDRRAKGAYADCLFMAKSIHQLFTEQLNNLP